MPYDQNLARRVRLALVPEPGIDEQPMFGGLAFLHWGNMTCGIVWDRLMIRVGRDLYTEALAEPHTAPMDFTGRPLRGIIYVLPEGYATDVALQTWIGRGLAYTSTLPPKRSGSKPRGRYTARE